MAARLCHRLSPSIKPVAAQQHAMGLRMIAQRGAELLGKSHVILRVLNHGYALEVHVRGNAGESLQQFVTLNRHVTCGCKPSRDQCVPDAVHMQDGARRRPLGVKHDMQASLRRRLATAGKHAAIKVGLEQIGRRERAFIEAACGDVQAIAHAHAEVAARRGHPSARRAPVGCGAEGFHLVCLDAIGHRRCSVATACFPARSFYNESLLSQDQRERLDVVLVAPRNPLNVGAAARAMANFGFARLSVVAPFEEHWREARSAVGAPEILQSAKSTERLAGAIADCTLVLCTGTLTYRKAEQRVVPLPELAPLVAGELARGGQVAVVFGPENHGLSRDDLSYCHVLVEIPTDAHQPSMNLGQAVAVCLYELAVRGGGVPAVPSDSLSVPSGELDRLGALIEETIIAAGYAPQGMQPANRHDLRLLLRRLKWNAKDTRRALGLFRRVLWRLAHPGK